MMYHLIIEGRLPSYNEYIAACRIKGQAGARFKAKDENAVVSYLRFKHKLKPISKPVYMRYRWYEANKKRDLDNISSYGRKIIQDALVKSRVLRNDGWDHITGFSDEFFIDKKHPRIEIDIEEIEND